MSKLKEFWHDLFNEKWIKPDPVFLGTMRPPLLKVALNSVISFWLKYWQPICAVAGIILATLTFYFQYLRE